MNFNEFTSAISSNGPGDTVPNYTATKDPNVVVGKHGAVITKQQYLDSLKVPGNNMKFTNFEAYADYVGGWAGKDGKPVGGVMPPPPQPIMSDKARGFSSTYYPAQQQMQGTAVPEIKSSTGRR